MTNWTVALGQMAVRTGEPEANLARGHALMVEAKRRGAELVCLPEMWTVGFDWVKNAALRERFASDAARVGKMAGEVGLWVAGSMPMVEGDGRLSNALMVFDGQGQRRAVYRKIHLFGLFDEPRHVRPGDAPVTVGTPWARVGLSVCYDLRFPELFRRYALEGVEVQLCPAAWPEGRVEHWRTLLRARAIEEQMFVLGVNQAGVEDFGSSGQVKYAGRSALIGPWGETIAEGGEGEELVVARIDVEDVGAVRAKMSVLKDRREEVYAREVVAGR